MTFILVINWLVELYGWFYLQLAGVYEGFICELYVVFLSYLEKDQKFNSTKLLLVLETILLFETSKLNSTKFYVCTWNFVFYLYSVASGTNGCICKKCILKYFIVRNIFLVALSSFKSLKIGLNWRLIKNNEKMFGCAVPMNVSSVCTVAGTGALHCDNYYSVLDSHFDVL